MCGIWALLTKYQIWPFAFNKYFKSFNKIKSRGPEYTNFQVINQNLIMGFHRLAIMDNSPSGNQPFFLAKPDGGFIYLICNGEIYNYSEILKKYNFPVKSKSDCEIILYLYSQFGINQVISELDGEFVFIICEINKNNIKLFAGRDPLGVRPLFYGITEFQNEICFSSEAKGLTNLYKQVYIFPPGNYLELDINPLVENIKPNFIKFYQYIYNPVPELPENQICSDIRDILFRSIKKRLISDREFGCLLSGGLDSSLVCAITRKILGKKFPVYTISFPGGTDLPYAKLAAKYLDLDHIIIEINPESALDLLDSTIYAVESYDITTIRASVAQFIIAREIAKTPVRVLLCGENSDELFQGYKYFHNQKNSMDGHQESIRLIQDIHIFDGLRTDRTMAAHGLEIRLPFADPELVNYILKLNPDLVKPRNNIEKYLLRKSWENTGILPPEILFRSKEALSDGISGLKKSWFNYIQEYINKIIPTQEFQLNKYIYNPPKTKEAYYYRKKYTEFFGDSEEISKLIPYYWMPKWSESVDPSARTLAVYN